MSNVTLDRIDRALLAHIQRNNRRPLRELAADIGISAPTCLRRSRRLESLRVIRGHTAVLDARLVGMTVTAFVEVTLRSASGAEMSAFERRIQRYPEVTQCSEIAGDVDYFLTVVTLDMPSFTEFTRKHLAGDRQVRAYRSLLVMRHTKDVPTLNV
jgi:Lrp/AsnC family leucine-responsive transcriptional regulator